MKIKNWQFWLGLLISIVFIWLSLRGLKLNEFWGIVQKANYFWLIPGVGVYFIGVWVRAWRWHYLLKPIKFDRFLKAVNRVIELKKPLYTLQAPPSVFLSETPEKIEKSDKTEKNHKDFIFIKDGTTNYKINFNDLLYIQAYGNFAKIYTTKQTIVASITMKHLEDDLPETLFTRVHKSYIVNIQKVNKIEGNLVFIDKVTIPVGAVYKMALDKKIRS